MILKHILLKPFNFHPFKAVNLIKQYSLFTINKPNIYSKNSIVNKRLFYKRIVSEEKYRMQDNLSSSYTLIYKTTLNRYVYLAQFMSVITLIGTTITLLFAAKPHKFRLNSIMFNDELEANLVSTNNEIIYFAIGLYVINIAVIIVTLKIPYRLYFNETVKTYAGVKPTLIPGRSSIFHFKPGQLVKHEGGILPWKQYEYKIKNGPKVILLDQYFRKPQDLNLMLGYVKN